MKIILLLFFLSCARFVEPFPIAASRNSARLQHRISASSDDQQIKDIDTEALSGLLGEMFQAKLEISRENKELESLSSENSNMPVLGNDGIYRIISQTQLENFKAAHSDKLVFLKFSSPICAACRMLKQKFQTLHRNPKFAGAPVVFADIVVSNNKKVQDPFRDYITSQLEVQRIPSIHFYASGSDALVDEIVCDEEGGCSWPKIQQTMLDFIGQYYTAPTAHDVASATAAATATVSTAANTIKSAATTVTKKMSKRQRIKKIVVSWIR